MEYMISLVIGDPGNDGHGITKSFVLQSNISADEVSVAYAKGAKLIKVDFCRDVAWRYMEPTINESDLARFVKAGFELDGMSTTLTTMDFVRLYLFIVGKGNPEFKYTLTHPATLEIGGYGFFDHDHRDG